jgi:hypothetical protein
MVGVGAILAKSAAFDSCLDEQAEWHRAVPSKFPPTDLWDRYASAREFLNAAVIEGLSSQRLRLQDTQLGALAPEEQLFGPGSTPVMAAFAYPNPDGSRFSAGDYGVYYAADSVATAMAEVGYHRRRFWLDNPEQPRQQVFRLYKSQAIEPLIDIRPEPPTGPLHAPDSWNASQAFGHAKQTSGAWGIRYRSVRHVGGECIALLRPLASTRVIQTAHVGLRFDGESLATFAA